MAEKRARWSHDYEAALAELNRLTREVGALTEEAPPVAERGVEAEGAPRLAYRVTIVAASPPATWEVSVDAASGAILSVRDRNAHVDGQGLVYDMTPVASTGDQSLTDGGDSATPALDAARFAVALPRLDGTGVLRGP